MPPPGGKVAPGDPDRALDVGGGGDAIDEYNDAAFRNWDENVLEPCPNCARTFLPEKLPRHMKLCTAAKPMKRLVARGPGEEVKVGRPSFTR